MAQALDRGFTYIALTFDPAPSPRAVSDLDDLEVPLRWALTLHPPTTLGAERPVIRLTAGPGEVPMGYVGTQFHWGADAVEQFLSLIPTTGGDAQDAEVISAAVDNGWEVRRSFDPRIGAARLLSLSSPNYFYYHPDHPHSATTRAPAYVEETLLRQGGGVDHGVDSRGFYVDRERVLDTVSRPAPFARALTYYDDEACAWVEVGRD